MPPPSDRHQRAVVDGSDPRTARVVVVGAGVAGLVAARELSAAHDVVVLDKARGVGGRMATRRIGDATFDHGAQFVTAHHEWFGGVVEHWCATGAAAEWFQGRVGPNGVANADGHPRHRGTVSMNALAKLLAEGLEVRREAKVSSLTAEEGCWRIELEGGEVLGADAVVLSAPVPQSLALVDAGGVVLEGADREALEAVTYDPCLAALIPLAGPSGLAEPGAVAPSVGPVEWIADNRMKGISVGHGVTVHADAQFSAERWELADAEVLAELVAAARESAGLTGAALMAEAQVQRWRYARPSSSHPETALVAAGVAPLVFCGDAFGEARVEGAAVSGRAAAVALAERLAVSRSQR